ncbi:AcrR family transcriptional regulator [Kitasatospora sp. MAP12-15]|uniref:helix-turn-helix domain-containing protein n=1 Tax=unclassified Kitasatospora TaxID=2633591 RepID=UPI0024733B49|nr:helix-turn-helix domain-containing protein [Kitasatospora sp. MAP12-44]MDH6111276.1 AcrR family transcriptional regulator [Kitasatospora sp. MAP12-44]
MAGQVAAAPGAGRRPRGRRAQILMVAAEQFHRSGYHQVAMAEVAAAVGITAPALYRHYRGKPELLRQAVRSGFDQLSAAVASAAAASADGAGGAAEALADALAGLAPEQRALGTLWQRDARLLPAAQRAELRRTLRADVRAAARLLVSDRAELSSEDAELMVWSALSVCASLSYHSFAPPRRRFERLLRELLFGLFSVSVGRPSAAAAPTHRPAPTPRPPAAAGEVHPVNRREALLTAAVRLFHERGFDNVSIDRLGAAVGIAGPSVYRHFPTKAELLAASLVRCRERLWHEVEAALRSAADPADPAEALARGLDAYVDFARRHHHYLGAMVSETDRLAAPDRKAALDFRRDFLRVWVGLLQQLRPDYDNAQARIRVHAMFAVVNDGVCNPPHAARPDLAPRLTGLALAVLGLPEGARVATPPGPPVGARPSAGRPA